jgi:hypothetical protein
MAILFITDIYHFFPEPFFHQSLLLLGSLIIGSLQLMKYRIRSSSSSLRFLVKVSYGIAVGGIYTWILLLPMDWRILVPVGLLFTFTFGFFSTFRLMYVNKICSGCIYHGDWDICFGFRGLNRYHSVSHIRSKKKIQEIMFDRNRKRSLPISFHPPASINDIEPPLKDHRKWLISDTRIFPWLPVRTMIVDRRENIPK